MDKRVGFLGTAAVMVGSYLTGGAQNAQAQNNAFDAQSVCIARAEQVATHDQKILSDREHRQETDRQKQANKAGMWGAIGAVAGNTNIGRWSSGWGATAGAAIAGAISQAKGGERNSMPVASETAQLGGMAQGVYLDCMRLATQQSSVGGSSGQSHYQENSSARPSRYEIRPSPDKKHLFLTKGEQYWEIVPAGTPGLYKGKTSNFMARENDDGSISIIDTKVKVPQVRASESSQAQTGFKRANDSSIVRN
jgi:hypothetical protein